MITRSPAACRASGARVSPTSRCARPTCSWRWARRSAKPTAVPGGPSTPSRSRPRGSIQIDIDPQEIGKIYPVEIGLVGDARTVLRQLNEHLQGTPAAADEVRARGPPTAAGCARAGSAELTASQHDDGVPIHPARLLRRDRQGGAEGRHLCHRRRMEQERRRAAAAACSSRSRSSPAAAWRRWGSRRRPRSARKSGSRRGPVIGPGRRRRLPVRVRRAHDRRRARHSGRLDHLQQLLLLDDSDGRASPISRTATGPSSRRPTASPTTRTFRCSRRRSVSRRRAWIVPADLPEALKAAFSANAPVPAGGAHARRRADAAHRLLGHRRLPGARQRVAVCGKSCRPEENRASVSSRLEPSMSVPSAKDVLRAVAFGHHRCGRPAAAHSRRDA